MLIPEQIKEKGLPEGFDIKKLKEDALEESKRSFKTLHWDCNVVLPLINRIEEMESYFRPVPDTVSEEKIADEGKFFICVQCLKVNPEFVNDDGNCFCSRKCALEFADAHTIPLSSSPGVAVASVFEKKTEFEGHELNKLINWFLWPVIAKMAAYLQTCHTEIERQEGVIKAQAKEIVKHDEFYNFWSKKVNDLESELSSLRVAREWIPIESKAQIAAVADGTYEVVGKNDGRLATWANYRALHVDDEYITSNYSHYRLITLASDYVETTTPKSQYFTIEGHTWCLDNLNENVRNEVLAAADAIKAGEADNAD